MKWQIELSQTLIPQNDSQKPRRRTKYAIGPNIRTKLGSQSS